MPTLIPTPIPTPIPTARVTAHLAISMCTCGQDLDVYRAQHCPRCGITLHHALTPAA